MLITDKFVFTHLPKTGGTFVRTAIRDLLVPHPLMRKIHSAKRRYRLWVPFFRYHYLELDQHATCKRIPDAYADLPILSCFRNPFDLLVSHYHFGWWKDRPDRWYADFRKVTADYPNFPHLTFEEFVHSSYRHQSWNEYTRRRAGGRETSTIGFLSGEFMAYYLPDRMREELLRRSQRPPAATEVRERMYPVHFILTHDLNRGLYDFLVQKGYPSDQLEFILSRGKVFSHRPRRDGWEDYYSPELKAFVGDKERLLVEFLDELT